MHSQGVPQQYAELYCLLTPDICVAQSHELIFRAAMLEILSQKILVCPLAYLFYFDYPKYLQSYKLRNEKSINRIEEKATVKEHFFYFFG
jgi:hypothetical protein